MAAAPPQQLPSYRKTKVRARARAHRSPSSEGPSMRRAVIFQLVVFLVLLPTTLTVRAATAGAQSTMFRGNPEHTGVSLSPLFHGQGGVKWRTQTGDAVRSSPAVTGRRIYVGSGDGHLYALDRATGSVVWRFDAGGAVDAS